MEGPSPEPSRDGPGCLVSEEGAGPPGASGEGQPRPPLHPARASTPDAAVCMGPAQLRLRKTRTSIILSRKGSCQSEELFPTTAAHGIAPSIVSELMM